MTFIRPLPTTLTCQNSVVKFINFSKDLNAPIFQICSFNFNDNFAILMTTFAIITNMMRMLWIRINWLEAVA
jgi:hypothetical protein